MWHKPFTYYRSNNPAELFNWSYFAYCECIYFQIWPNLELRINLPIFIQTAFHDNKVGISFQIKIFHNIYSIVYFISCIQILILFVVDSSVWVSVLHNIEVLSKEFSFFFKALTSVERSLARLGEIACVIKNVTSNIIWYDYSEYLIIFFVYARIIYQYIFQTLSLTYSKATKAAACSENRLFFSHDWEVRNILSHLLFSWWSGNDLFGASERMPFHLMHSTERNILSRPHVRYIGWISFGIFCN